MSQFDFGNLESPLSGATFINGNLEPWRDALLSMHSGDTRPSYAVEGLMWLDTTTDPWILNVFTGTTDIPVGSFDTSTNEFLVSTSLSGADISINSSGFVILSGTNLQAVLNNLDTFLQTLGTGAFQPAIAAASQAEAEAGTENTKFMTALRTAQAIVALQSGYRKIQDVTIAAGTAQVVVNNFVSGSDYEIDYTSILGSASSAVLNVQTSTDNGSTFATAAASYLQAYVSGSGGSPTAAGGGASVTAFQSSPPYSNLSGRIASGKIDLRNPNDATYNTYINSSSFSFDGTAAYWQDIRGTRANVEANNAIRLIPSSGNLQSGNLRIWRKKP